jgi:hypothetical protein
MISRAHELLSAANAAGSDDVFTKPFVFTTKHNQKVELTAAGNFLLKAIMDPDIDRETFTQITALKLNKEVKFKQLNFIKVTLDADPDNAFELLTAREFAEKYKSDFKFQDLLQQGKNPKQYLLKQYAIKARTLEEYLSGKHKIISYKEQTALLNHLLLSVQNQKNPIAPAATLVQFIKNNNQLISDAFKIKDNYKKLDELIQLLKEAKLSKTEKITITRTIDGSQYKIYGSFLTYLIFSQIDINNLIYFIKHCEDEIDINDTIYFQENTIKYALHAYLVSANFDKEKHQRYLNDSKIEELIAAIESLNSFNYLKSNYQHGEKIVYYITNCTPDQIKKMQINKVAQIDLELEKRVKEKKRDVKEATLCEMVLNKKPLAEFATAQNENLISPDFTGLAIYLVIYHIAHLTKDTAGKDNQALEYYYTLLEFLLKNNYHLSHPHYKVTVSDFLVKKLEIETNPTYVFYLSLLHCKNDKRILKLLANYNLVDELHPMMEKSMLEVSFEEGLIDPCVEFLKWGANIDQIIKTSYSEKEENLIIKLPNNIKLQLLERAIEKNNMLLVEMLKDSFNDEAFPTLLVERANWDLTCYYFWHTCPKDKILATKDAETGKNTELREDPGFKQQINTLIAKAEEKGNAKIILAAVTYLAQRKEKEAQVVAEIQEIEVPKKEVDSINYSVSFWATIEHNSRNLYITPTTGKNLKDQKNDVTYSRPEQH